MESIAYAQVARLEADNWWYVARRDLLDRTLTRLRGGRPFAVGLDLGCGVGGNLPVLARHCDRVVGVDYSPDAVAWCRAHGFAGVEPGDLHALAQADATADLAVCTDVLEHLDDARAVAEIRRVLRPGGYLVLTVPAFAALWNENDSQAHHQRRYTSRQLRELLAGLAIVELSYWNATMFLPALAYCAVRRLTGPGAPKNNLERIPSAANGPLRAALWLENRLREVVAPPFGTSLFAVARRS